MFNVQVIRQGKPIRYGSYGGKDAYRAAKDRMKKLLEILTIGTVEIVANGFVIDREAANLFHATAA